MRPRPLVDFTAPIPPDQLLARVRGALSDESPCTGHVGTKEFSLEVRGDRSQPFAPRISLNVEPVAQGSRVWGRFGPKPNLWTAFVFTYALQVAVFVGGSILGLVQLSLGGDLTGLWIGLVAFASLGLSCGVDLTARRRHDPHIQQVRHFIDELVPEQVHSE